MDARLTDIVAVMVSVSVEGPYSYRVPPGMHVERGSIVAVPPFVVTAIFPLAPLDQDLRQIVETVEGELPALQIQRFARNAGRGKRRDAGDI